MVQYIFFLSTANKMQHYTIFFIIVPGLLAATASSGVPGLLAATASGSSKQAWHVPYAVCTVF
jgi:hypothetical protein